MKLLTTRICMNSDIGVHGSLFSGTMLAWLGEAGTLLACEHCRTPRMVTRKISEVVFERSLKAGRIVRIYGEILSVGTTSLSVHIVAKGHDPASEGDEPLCELDMLFVHVDDQGVPRALPRVAHERGARARRVALVAPGPASAHVREVSQIRSLPDSNVSAG